MKTHVRSKVHQKQSESCMIWPHPRTASPSPQVLSTPGPPGLSWAALLWLRYKGRSSPPRPRGRQHSAPAGELPWSEGRASPARTARPRELLGGRKTTPGLWRKFEYVMMSMYLGKKPFGFYDGDWGKIEGSWSSWWSWWGKNALFFPTKLPFKNHHNFQCMSSTFLRIILPTMQHVLLIKEVNMVTVRKRNGLGAQSLQVLLPGVSLNSPEQRRYNAGSEAFLLQWIYDIISN